MPAITATEARKSLFGLIRQVNDDHTAVEVVSRHGNVVIMSKADYDAMTETAYLLRNPANAERLLAAIARGAASSSSAIFWTLDPDTRLRPERVGGRRRIGAGFGRPRISWGCVPRRS